MSIFDHTLKLPFKMFQGEMLASGQCSSETMSESASNSGKLRVWKSLEFCLSMCQPSSDGFQPSSPVVPVSQFAICQSMCPRCDPSNVLAARALTESEPQLKVLFCR